MGRPLKIMKAGNTSLGYPNVGSLTAPVTPDGLAAGEFYGVVGGNIAATQNGTPVYPQTVIAAAGPSTGNPVVLARIKIAGEDEEDGYIARQKGGRKYLVYGATSTKSAVCVLANKADGTLADGEMTLTVFTGDSTAIRLSKLTNKYATDFTGGTAGSPNNLVYFVNFFQGVDGETAIKSGVFNNGTIELAAIESDPATGPI